MEGRTKRKDNDETVLLNGRKDVSFVVTTDRRSQSVVGTNVPRYIVAELRNDAAVPIVVQWKENGVDKSAEVDVGKTVVRELVFADELLRCDERGEICSEEERQ